MDLEKVITHFATFTGMGRRFQKIGEFNGCTSTVFVNGKLTGYIDKEPYTLCLDKGDLVAGQNEIKVCLFGSFRNMFGPSHFVDLTRRAVTDGRGTMILSRATALSMILKI